MQSLNVSNNRISVLPENMTNLVHLRLLDASGNSLQQPLTGIIEALGTCLQLSSLDLTKNMLRHYSSRPAPAHSLD